MISIYKITSPSYPGKCYIGSTKRILKNRLREHYYSLENKNKVRVCTSSQILDRNDAIIELLEICTSENRRIREQYHIDTNECINQYDAHSTPERQKMKTFTQQTKWRLRPVICMICDKEINRAYIKTHFKIWHTEM